jgi:hypothetical protein
LFLGRRPGWRAVVFRTREVGRQPAELRAAASVVTIGEGGSMRNFIKKEFDPRFIERKFDHLMRVAHL